MNWPEQACRNRGVQGRHSPPPNPAMPPGPWASWSFRCPWPAPASQARSRTDYYQV